MVVSTRKRVLLVSLIVVGSVVLVAAALFATVLINAVVVANDSLAKQEERIASLGERLAELPDGVFADWRETPIDDRVTWDRVQSIATHNSYVTAPNLVQNTVLDLVRPGEAAPLAYSHDPLWEQLEQGVRSIELDLRVHSDGSLRLTHVPLLANGSTAPDFVLALDELALWSSSHPGHLPITVLIEFKSDFAYLDPSLVAWSSDTLSQVDTAIIDGLGDRVLRPAELDGDTWPLVRDIRDRVLLIMHPDSHIERAYSSLPTADRVMFVARAGEKVDAAMVAAGGPVFVVHNDPTPASIAPLVEAGAIVRTRADADLHTDPAALARALESGAQVISTDFPAPIVQPGTGYSAGFPDAVLSRIDPARMPTAAELRRVDALAWVDAASTRELAGSVIMATIVGTNTDQLRQLMVESGLGGFILMAGNVPGTADELSRVTEALTIDPALPPLIAIDEEGGVVKRIPWDPYPGANTLRWASEPDVHAAFAGRAELLAGVGVNVNFGVVADVTANPRSFIYSRTLGDDPTAAGQRVGAAVSGERGLVASTLKHFPGHGAAPGDSHFAVPRTGMTQDAWRSHDSVPFTAGIDAGAELLMFGHLSYTAVTSTPATLAPEWYVIARDELGFEGVIITDDLSMLRATGLAQYRDVGALAVTSLVAGADVALVVAGMDYGGVIALVDRVEAAANNGELSAERLRDAAIRVTELRLLLGEQAAARQ